jgi:hypothetical protein
MFKKYYFNIQRALWNDGSIMYERCTRSLYQPLVCHNHFSNVSACLNFKTTDLRIPRNARNNIMLIDQFIREIVFPDRRSPTNYLIVTKKTFSLFRAKYRPIAVYFDSNHPYHGKAYHRIRKLPSKKIMKAVLKWAV